MNTRVDEYSASSFMGIALWALRSRNRNKEVQQAKVLPDFGLKCSRTGAASKSVNDLASQQKILQFLQPLPLACQSRNAHASRP